MKGHLLGFDEVQCGVGRTGKLLPMNGPGNADVMAIAKLAAVFRSVRF